MYFSNHFKFNIILFQINFNQFIKYHLQWQVYQIAVVCLYLSQTLGHGSSKVFQGLVPQPCVYVDECFLGVHLLVSGNGDRLAGGIVVAAYLPHLHHVQHSARNDDTYRCDIKHTDLFSKILLTDLYNYTHAVYIHCKKNLMEFYEIIHVSGERNCLTDLLRWIQIWWLHA